ncbi:hypothetical protein GWK47_015532 [Chionoecetes opilio]|uniref:CHK kinase-like domain-containing protein n=1 Tax=Chionoecetes opilio TaxID=41210 RepID=A0A8J4XX81_CHIOP|nr:hypothetical protein GWK47_015532 [Chionoecetes opilio]
MADEQPAAGGDVFLHESSPSTGENVRPDKGGGGNPHVTSVAVQEDCVRHALKQDQGSSARLLSWSRHDFTNKGDNYVAEVTSVRVKYSVGAHTRHASYVVKMRHGRPDSHFDDMVFLKEGKFYTELLPLLNAKLTRAGQEPLRVPRCYHATWHEHESQLYLEDLRLRHFKMYDRKQPLTLAHASLAVRELARLHAASVLLLTNSPQKASSFVFLSWEMYNYSQQTLKAFEALICGSLETAGELARAADRMDMQTWFSSLAPRGADLLSGLIRPVMPFDVIGHGDCWVNNLLFREDDRGEPLEVMLLDFQLCRRSSPALDLNYLLFSSLTAAQRSRCLTQLLDTYYSTFRTVLTAASHVPPFTQEQFAQEFHNKTMFGLIFGALAVPALMCDARDAQEFTMASEDHTVDYVLKKREKALTCSLPTR